MYWPLMHISDIGDQGIAAKVPSHQPTGPIAHQHPSVRKIGITSDRIWSFFGCTQLLARLIARAHVPNPYEPVLITGCDQNPAVRTEIHGANAPFVCINALHQL